MKIDDHNVFKRTYTFNQATVLVAEAFGSDSLFPVVTPKEDPPADLSTVLGSLLSSVGGDSFGSTDGLRGPSPIQKVTPYAFTNPIWLDITAANVLTCQSACSTLSCQSDCELPDGIFNPPGNSTGPGKAPDKALGECDVGSTCPAGQICDTTQSPSQCVCSSESALVAEPFNPAAVFFTPPAGGQHFHRRDIRQIFAVHYGH